MLGALIGLLLVVGVALSGAHADQTDSRLPGLFEQLLEAPTPEQAARLELEIWRIWTAHGDATVEGLMDSAAADMAAYRYGSALQTLDRVVELAPGYAEGWNRRATLYYLVGRFHASLVDIERVLALEPRHFGALSGRGLCLVQLDRPEAAMAAFAAALAVHPHMQGARANLEALGRLLGDDL